MKRRVILSSIISIIVTAILCGINWLNVAITGNIFGIEFSGGEYIQWRGLGVVKEKVYPLYHIDNPIESAPSYAIDPISLIGTLIIVFLIIFMIMLVCKKKSKLQ